MSSFELLSSQHFHVILHSDKKHGLIFNRLDGSISTINHDDATELSTLKKVGRIYGIIGHYLNRYIVLIKNRTFVGALYDPNTKKEHDIYVITQVQVIDITCTTGKSDSPTASKASSVRYDASANAEANPVESSRSHKDLTGLSEDFSSLPITISTSSYNNSMQARSAQWNPFKFANALRPKMPTQFLRSTAGSDLFTSSEGGNSGLAQANISADDSDKRLVEEMVKLFNNTNSFYYSPTLDLTRRFSKERPSQEEGALWKTADERFFWNKYMLKDLIELRSSSDDANIDLFICVIMQGFVAIKQHSISSNTFSESGIETGLLATSTNSTSAMQSSGNTDICDTTRYDKQHNYRHVARQYQLALISRRSVFHAGTRYRRRGCDEEGNCANFVETEQIFRYRNHFTSLSILRGSIPLYWYQKGYNYRPPPVMYRSHDENHQAFVKHFKRLIEDYVTDNIITVDCTEQSGRESKLHSAFKTHIHQSQTNGESAPTKHIEFDFHRYCRGRQVSDFQVEKSLRFSGLTDEAIKKVEYYWNDGDVVCKQGGVFRVNCLDCSDRTNVVQRVIALQILDRILGRLGVLPPDTCPEDNIFRQLQSAMWTENGNILSRQYCGTGALFTGDRRLAGYLKDTYSSASRYYYSKFRDAYRQAAIDAMLGVETPIIDYDGVAGQKDLDQYELISLDPILAGRSGGALLKDMGSKVTDRLSRLRGKFYVKPQEAGNMEAAEDIGSQLDDDDPGLLEATVDESLGGLDIDWPSTESVHDSDANRVNNVFARLSHSDDSFQDDEFGNHLMLSIDVAELQRIRENEYKSNSDVPGDKVEEIHMTEACDIKIATSSSNASAKTTTTST